MYVNQVISEQIEYRLAAIELKIVEIRNLVYLLTKQETLPHSVLIPANPVNEETK